MRNNNINAGSHPVGLQIQAAEAFHNGVLKQQSLANSLFDKFATFMEKQRKIKREDENDSQRRELFKEQKQHLLNQNALLQKNIKAYDKTLEADLYAKKASASNALAHAAQVQKQKELLNENLQEIKDYKKLLKSLDADGLNGYYLNKYANDKQNIIGQDDIQNALNNYTLNKE